MRLIDKFIKEVDSIIKADGETPYFWCAYGSYPNYNARAQSDIDYFVIQPSFQEKLFDILKSFTIEFHHKYWKPLDQEVPYKNKLIILEKTIEDAVEMKMFLSENKEIIISPIQYTSEYLWSIEIQQRLLFNALTSPHFKFGDHNQYYETLKKRAEFNLLQLAKNISKKQEPTQRDLINILLYGPNGENGESWLWYKVNRNKTIQYITKLVCKYY